ncbi:MAG: DUF4405 domain-containing protein [Vitreoscilla sp.]|nr:DUF4405 domain-containing protein [Vitreoscilla sp.]MBP6677034.1 DUF4405 domain-containing protein [Vitreoscilla sp.]
MKISRDWATPLTIGAFGLMAITGILMFFHLDSGLNKTAHEWLGWLMVAGVAAHASANWLGFKRYFLSSPQGRSILAASVLVTAGSFVSLSAGGEGGGSPPQLAIRAVTQAPLARVAPLTGRTVEQLIAELSAAGIQVSGGEQSLAQAIGADRERTGKALKVMFRGPGP